MIIEALQRARFFTGQDDAIAKFVIANPSQILSLNATQLAKLSYSSPASVVRFCKKLGFKGFVDFQRQFNYEMGLSNQKTKDATEFNRNTKETADFVLDMYHTAIHETRNLMDDQKLKRIIGWMLKAKSIDFYASSHNFTKVQNMCLKLSSLNIHAKAFNDMHQDYLQHADSSTCLCVLLSHTGHNPLILEIAKTLKNEKFKLVGITNAREQALEKFCDESIYLYTANGPIQAIPFGVSVDFILDVIYVALLNHKKYEIL